MSVRVQHSRANTLWIATRSTFESEVVCLHAKVLSRPEAHQEGLPLLAYRCHAVMCHETKVYKTSELQD
eukprot:1841452-Amphidinium_carterae.1